MLFEIAALSRMERLASTFQISERLFPTFIESERNLSNAASRAAAFSLSLSAGSSFHPTSGSERREKRSRLSVFRAEFQIDAAIRGISRSTELALGAIGVTVYA